MALFKSKPAPDVPRRRLDNDSPRDQQRAVFVRNRTLTGSSSSQVTGVNDHLAQLQSPRTQAHQLARRRRHVGAVFLAVGVLAALLYALISQFTSTVIVHASEPGVTLDSRYVQAIQGYLDHQPMERLRFMLNDHQLLSYVQSKDPEVANLTVDGGAGYATTAFTVTLRQPTLSWTIGEHHQYVDSSGVAFTTNYFAAPPVQVVDNSGIQVTSGQTVASNRFLSFMGRIVGLAGAAGYKVTQVVLPQGMSHEVDLKIDGFSYPIRLLVDRPAGEQIEDMDRAVRWLKAHNVTPSQYLDVRVSRRAYYL